MVIIFPRRQVSFLTNFEKYVVGAFVHIGQTDLPHAVDGVNCEDLEDFTDFDEGLVPISDSNSNSRKTSTTLPNKSSKRGHDEIDSDDGVDSWYDGSQPSSPGPYVYRPMLMSNTQG